MARERRGLTERDRYWLGHQEACEGSGLSAKAYARKQRISIHAFYQARKRLRAMGALGTPGSSAAVSRKGGVGSRGSGRFARVEVPAAPRPRYRVRLSNGAVVEWEGVAGDELGRVLDAVCQFG